MQYPVTVLGPGRRLVLWVQGCTLACPGCVSRDTWDSAAGADIAPDDLAEVWAAALADGADGITVSGGEPLQQAEAVGALLAALETVSRSANRSVDVLMYTGYEPEELHGLGPAAARVIEHVDALITGRYRAERPTALIWRGSANQRLIPRTVIGHRRYDPFLEHEEDAAQLQVNVDDEDVGLIGIPRRGVLPRLERSLRGAGIEFRGVSWRP
jgi:anaerobic ribonucleoside-triphosphate reductase activating protein